MRWLTRAILAVVYFVNLPLALVFRGGWKKRLRIDDPGGESYWITRPSDLPRESYFSQASAAEAHDCPSPFFARLLRGFSRLYAPRADQNVKVKITDREQGVPDEIYTLW